MICLLCYDSNGEFTTIDSDQGKESNISSLLQKHFGFLFVNEPCDGNLCIKCWDATLSFHKFYTHIESIHELINKTKEAFHSEPEPVKIEIDENDSKEEESYFSDCDNWSLQNDQVDFDPVTDDPSANTTDVLNVNEIKNEDYNVEKSKKKVIKKENKKVPKSTLMSKKKGKGRGGKRDRKPKKVVFTCKIKMCHEEFENQDALIQHKINAHRRIQCTHCPDLKLVVDLNKHLRNTHGISQNSMCEHCGQVYTNTRSLQDHIQRKHETSDPLQCDICKEWFKSRDTIRAHMNYVHVQGPQTCSICGKISANRKALRKHQTIHMESWKDRFKCIICGRGFRDSTKLKEHSYIHSGVTDAYFCQFCGQSFRFGSSLSAHRMKHHPIEMAHVKDRLQRKKNLEFKV